MEKYGFVYIWRDRKHKRYYIGSHWGTETDKYICSSRWMRKAYRRRPEDFKRRILVRGYSDRAELLAEEERWLNMIKPEEAGKKYYNLKFGSQNHWTATDNKLSISEKLSKAQRGFMWYTDGVSSFKFREGDEIPEGLVRGKQSSLREHYNLHPEARVKAGDVVKRRLKNPEVLESHVASLKKVDFKARAESLKRTYDDRPELREAARQRAKYQWAEGGVRRS